MTIDQIYHTYGISDGESGFGPRSFDGYHWGQDLPTPIGVEIHAHVDGRLVLSGFYDGVGIIVLEHADGSFNDQFGHLSAVAHPLGSQVHKGDFLGKTGMTGADAPHLHFEHDHGHFKGSITANHNAGTTIDPLPYIQAIGGTNEDMSFEEFTRILAAVGQNNPDYPQESVDHWVESFKNGFDPETAMRQFLNEGDEFLSQHRALKEYHQAREDAGNLGYPGGAEQFATDLLAGGDTHNSVMHNDMAYYVPLEHALEQSNTTNDQLQEEIDHNEIVIQELHEALDECHDNCASEPSTPSDPSTPTPPDSEPATPPVASQGLLERLIDTLTKWLNRN